MLGLTPDIRFICVYLYTNSHIGLTDIYKVPVQLIQLETGYDISTIKLAIEQLKIVKIVNHYNHLWIRLLKREFASLEYSGNKNEKAVEKYLEEIPKEVLEYLQSDTSIDTTIHSSHKSEIINQKSKTINQNSEIKEDTFSIFWEKYPKKELKKKTREIWERNHLGGKLAEILAFIEKAKDTDRWKKGYIKQPTVFLNGECWTDDLSNYNDRTNGKNKPSNNLEAHAGKYSDVPCL